MFPESGSFTSALSSAHAEALRVGDSPLRADQLAAKLVKLTQRIGELEAPEDVRLRVEDTLTRAEQTLRRDDDGNQAARLLKEAMRHAESAPRGAERKAPWE